MKNTAMNPTTIPQKAIDLILLSEGIDQPFRWPGGGSGITLGYGCDIGADPASLEFWKPHLTPDQISLLAQAKGKTGRAAAQIQTRFKSIVISKRQALEVFSQQSLPREIALTLKAFAGVQFMPGLVLGAMVSLVYNRGTALDGDRRKEMRIIHEILEEFGTFDEALRAAVQNEYIRKIAIQFRKMKRIWQGQNLPGLLIRRDAEADLCLDAIV